jgi:hypothetical protein
MNEQFKYILEPYTGLKSRTTCPACQKKNQFARYIDIDTKEPLSDIAGRCNREINCGYHYTPKQYFEDNKHLKTIEKDQVINNHIKPIETPAKPISEIPFDIFKKTRKQYRQNNFFNYIQNIIGEELALKVFSLYHVGTSKHWQGATIFWQIDYLGRIRAGKIMLYNKETGKRIKEPFPHITWIHKLTPLKDYELNQCLFGEHLLQQFPKKQIAIVESEKTAILAAAYLPTFNWLAAGNLNNLSRKRCESLKGKTVLLFPDAGAFSIWKDKAKALTDIASFVVSDLIETKATPQQIKKGFDLADYFEGNSEEVFTGPREFEQTQINTSQKIKIKKFDSEYSYPEEFLNKKQKKVISWPIEELEKYFLSISIQDQPILLNNHLTIDTPSKFISNHLSIIKSNNGNPTFKPYYDSLMELKNYLAGKNL